jgi:DNA-directed RNA polymerase specialized sigma24 family protein
MSDSSIDNPSEVGQLLDRAGLALRHVEQLSNGGVAQALGLSKSTASKRCIRALQRLKEILAAGRGGIWEL